MMPSLFMAVRKYLICTGRILCVEEMLYDIIVYISYYASQYGHRPLSSRVLVVPYLLLGDDQKHEAQLLDTTLSSPS